MGLGKTYSTKYLLDSNNSSGVAGQVLSTTSTGIDWVNANTVPGAGLWIESGNNIYNSNSGNVGIGTTSPNDKLDIEGANSQLRLTDSDDNKFVQFSYSSSFLSVRNNSTTTATNQFTLTENGNLGVGTTSPVSHSPGRRTIVVSDLVDGSNFETHGNLGGKALLQSVGGDCYVGNLTKGTGAGTTYLVSGNGALSASILANGNFGIGTTTPSFQLSIENHATTTSTATLEIDGKRTNGTDGPVGELIFSNNGDTFATVAGVRDTADNKGSLQFQTQDSTFATRMTISSEGNVGIGTTIPGAKLDVVGPSNGSSILKLQRNGVGSGYAFGISDIGTGGLQLFTTALGDDSGFVWQTRQSGGSVVEALFIAPDGKVGIGTTTPSSKLQLKGDSTYLEVRAADNSQAVQLGTDGSGDGLLQLYSDAGAVKIKLYGEAASPSYINAGNFGIGVTAPTQKLHVVGGLRVTGAYYDSSNDPGTPGQVLSSYASGTNWVGASGLPGGPYLPLSAGASFPLTGALNINLGSTNVATIQLRRDTAGDSQIVGDIEFDTTAAQGTDDRIALIRAQTSGGDGTVRGGEMRIYTRQSSSSVFNTTIYDKGGSWSFPSNITTGGQITVPSGYSINFGTSRLHSTNTSYLLGGNVGIGTTSPAAKLDVRGVIESPYLEFKPYVFYDFNSNSVGQWGKNNATLSTPSKSITRFTTTGTDSNINRNFDGTSVNSPAIPGGQNQIIRIRYKWISGTASQGEIFYKTSGHGYDGGYYKTYTLNADGEFHTLVLDMSNLTAGGTDWIDNDITGIRFDFINTTPIVIDIDWISVGGNGWGTQYFENDVAFTNGSVGIGTASPGGKLEVVGTSLFRGGAMTLGGKGGGSDNSSYEFFFQGQNSSAALRTQASLGSFPYAANTDAGELIFKTANTSSVLTERIRIDGVGNVGIGTNSPGSSGFAKLHVCNGTPATYTPNSEADTLVLESSTPGGISLIGTGAGGNAKQAIVFGTTAGPSSASIIYDGNNSKLVIGTTSASQVVIFNSGNSALALTLDASQNAIFNSSIGIGTTNPNSKLTVSGPATPAFDNGENSIRIENHSSANASPGEIGNGINFAQKWWSGSAALQVTGGIYGIKNAANGTFGGGLAFYTQPSSGADMAQRMVIDTLGNVGIGTTTPSRGNLVVKGDFQTTASGDGQLAIISGVSGSNPATKDIGGQMVFGGPISASDSNRTFGLVGGYKENNTSGDRAGYLTFGTRQNAGSRDIFERMRIDSIGNVGIGTTVPGAKLDVEDGHIRNTNNSSADFLDIFCDGEGTGSSIISSSSNDIVIRSANGELGIKANAFGNTGNHGVLKVYDGSTALGVVKITLNSNGNSTFTSTITASNFILSSDKRLKENIKTLEPKVISAEWRSFNAKDDDSYRTGVIAQELEVKHPEFVETNEEGFKSVKYIDLLISKIAELEHRIKQLEK